MSQRTTELYLRSPIWVQQVMVATWGLWWYHRRFGRRFRRLAAEYAARDRWSRDRFDAYQEALLAQVLSAARRSRYYAEVFARAGIESGTDARAALERLPYLTKETLRTRAVDLLTERPPRGTQVFKSSGTTGTPTEIYSTPEAHAHQTAVRAARGHAWAGLAPTARRVMFGVRKVCRFDQAGPPFWRFSPAEDMAYASIYHLAPRHLPAYMAFLREFRPDVIMGYPSALGVVARYALETGDRPAPARGVFTTSETVTDGTRDALERTWQCRVFDHYGAVEACVFASQCEAGRYHVSPEIGIVEIVDQQGRPCPPGVMGEVVCTGLRNTLQPLIRYRIGDVARWAIDQACPCGREMPVLESCEGRFEDICVTADGGQVLRFDTVFKGVSAIREAQVVQEAARLFTIRVVPGDGFSEADVHTLTANMRLHVGDCDVRIVRVPLIERTEAGKFRAVICRLSPREKQALSAARASLAAAAADRIGPGN